MCNLIADAGSSKIDWVVTDSEFNELARVSTPGVNALTGSPEALLMSFAQLHESLRGTPADGASFAEAHYYGAGCAGPVAIRKVRSALEAIFHTDIISVESDMLGAARSLLGKRRGIACIIGTGSNSCLYDGYQIADNVPALGYILGDEGSGALIGRTLLSDFLKRRMPRALSNDFSARYGIDAPIAIERVYRGEAPSKFLASFVPFAADYQDEPYIDRILRHELGRFIDRNVKGYADWQSLPVAFTGGIAFNFRNILREECARRGISVDSISDRPLCGIVDFHRNHI